jgi:hypothetical protein
MRDFDTSVGLLSVDRSSRTIKHDSGIFSEQEHSDSLYENTQLDPRVKGIFGDQRAVSKLLVSKGYARCGPDFVGTVEGDIGLARDAFMSSIRDIPLDPDCATGNRRRRYHVFYYHPWCHSLESKPPVFDPIRKERVMRFVQSADHNPEHQGNPRAFAPFTVEQRINGFLKFTIQKCHSCLGLDPTDSVIVGAHIIQLVAPAASSPNLFHRDGEKWTWAFLLERSNVVGGENFIAKPEAANRDLSQVAESDVFERFTLETPFEGWVVQDDKVSHYVSPVTIGDNNTVGWRTVLLLDFCRAIPELV